VVPAVPSPLLLLLLPLPRTAARRPQTASVCVERIAAAASNPARPHSTRPNPAVPDPAEGAGAGVTAAVADIGHHAAVCCDELLLGHARLVLVGQVQGGAAAGMLLLVLQQR
jgi:hypothetical protein